MVTKLLITSDGRGPAMTVDGLASDVATIDAVEQSLRDEKHTVESRQSSPDTSRPGYTRSFTIIVRPESASGRRGGQRSFTRSRQPPTNRSRPAMITIAERSPSTVFDLVHLSSCPN